MLLKVDVVCRTTTGLWFSFSFSKSTMWPIAGSGYGDSVAGIAPAAGVLLRPLILRFERSLGDRGRLVVTLLLVKLNQFELAARRKGVGNERKKR